ncbi:hypothetical protein LTR96_010141 [Exophiala xenobiotica]|nr:hypothetical protein LTR92_010508 [Exophiala xenobiotica]KAK5264661.1 hypothetical protein LTR96_010141 [Exophiala xenobiotica]KAK5333672.1 hypothetical protein LTR98_010372 [Exophiala xenobiotica]KAK5552398.1 hypothetical protein LTR46_009445 [Exophiala xenobiotica]
MTQLLHSAWMLSIGICAVLVLASYNFIIYPVFFSPLAKIPNAHFLAPVTSLWITWKRFKRQNRGTIHLAHKTLGPIVRLGPNEISLNSLEGVKAVYTGGFDKHDWYPTSFSDYGELRMFTMVHSRVHAERKRMVSHVYSKSFLQSSPQFEEVSKAVLYRYLAAISRAVQSGKAVEVWSLNNALSMDFISGFEFGLANSSKWLIDDKLRAEMMGAYHAADEYEFYAMDLPVPIKRLCAWAGIPMVPKHVLAGASRMNDWTMSMVLGADKIVRHYQIGGKQVPIVDQPLLFKQLKLAFLKSTSSTKQNVSDILARTLTPRERNVIASECYDNMTAGMDTSAIVLTYLYWEMSKRPALQAKLRAELLTLSPNLKYGPSDSVGAHGDLPNPKDIDRLPLLHAIVYETLRRHSPAPGMQPRVTPKDGTYLAGFGYIPGNVRVESQPYSMHRNTEAFPDPEEWDPDRWITDLVDPEDLERRKRWFWAFSSGSRMCIGIHLAMQEIKLVTSELYTNFTSKIVDDRGMEQEDGFIAPPHGRKLILEFSPVGSPSPLPIGERPIDELSREELQDLVRRQREQQTIKQGNGGIKHERSGTVTEFVRPLKSSKGACGETIYHCLQLNISINYQAGYLMTLLDDDQVYTEAAICGGEDEEEDSWLPKSVK